MAEHTKINNLDLNITRTILGTWAIGGWQWGGTNEKKSVDTVLKAIDMGITTIDTAAIYGFGKSEQLVGKAVQDFGDREKVQICTKFGLEWDEDENVERNCGRDRILKEVEDSLKRLQTDYIDIYQIHWPDTNTDFEKTAKTMQELLNDGTIRAIGVSNFDTKQMDEFRKTAPIHTCQSPYNLFERGIENDIVPYCTENNISLITYGALCRGLLTGKMDKKTSFDKGDLRRNADPKFQGETFKQHLQAVEALQEYTSQKLNKKLLHAAVRWILDKDIDAAIWGARKPDQVTFNEVFGWHLSDEQLETMEKIVNDNIEKPISPAFMAPPE